MGLYHLVHGDWRYVKAQLWDNEQKQLTADSPNLGTWETFTICTTPISPIGDFHYGSPFALKADNGYFVTYNPDGDEGKKRVLAWHDYNRSSETFVFINPHDKQNN